MGQELLTGAGDLGRWCRRGQVHALEAEGGGDVDVAVDKDADVGCCQHGSHGTTQLQRGCGLDAFVAHADSDVGAAIDNDLIKGQRKRGQQATTVATGRRSVGEQEQPGRHQRHTTRRCRTVGTSSSSSAQRSSELAQLAQMRSRTLIQKLPGRRLGVDDVV